MTTNPYVNFFDNAPEQQLMDSLIVESIQMYGRDMYYIVREGTERPVMKDMPNVEFKKTANLEMMIKSIDGYAGEGMFLSNFGMEIRHQALLTVPISRWNTVNAEQLAGYGLTRPREGDLIYFAMDNKMLEIRKVNQYNLFYQLGTLYTYDLLCEVFEYSSEKFDTGIPAIDAIASLSLSTNELGDNVSGIPEFNPDFDLDRLFADSDNKDVNDAADTLIDFSEDNPFSERF